MTCYHPINGWKSQHVNPKTGKRSVTFNRTEAYQDLPVTLACGNCIGCRLAKSKEWAIRCLHESQYYDENSFVTLTYDNENLPPDANLNLAHFQKFMKRLRKSIEPKKIRFYHCGEYGKNDPDNKLHQAQYKISKLGRPHYHVLIFGHDFPDKEHHISTRSGHDLFTSKSLELLWPYGYSSIGALSFDSAAYVARYVTKKINGELSRDHYTRTDVATGETVTLNPEYTTMSRGGKSPTEQNLGGIGRRWFEEFGLTDLYTKDYTTNDGAKNKAPKYYDNLLEIIDNELYQDIKMARTRAANRESDNRTPEKLYSSQTIKNQQNNMLLRPLDGDPQ